MSLLKQMKKGKLDVRIYDTRKSMGEAAGNDIADTICRLLETKECLNMIFAAAPSQNETLETLVSRKDIDWTKINAFHMDEYIGLKDGAPQRFGSYLEKAIFGKVPFKNVNYINASMTDAGAECERYEELLKNIKIDIVVLGIGENGHIAFNDPPVADFEDKHLVKPVRLDEVCRMQQVHDGCFERIEDVPECAVTLTIPALLSADYLFCSVPAASKAQAVKHTVTDEMISTSCPATIMRTHPGAVLYCDADSGSLLI